MSHHRIDDPLLSLGLRPKTTADQEKLGIALARLAAEDPSFRVSTDYETGQTMLHGNSEPHLALLVDRIVLEFMVEAHIDAPQVAYRETISHEVEHTYSHHKQSGESRRFAEVCLVIAPTMPGEGYSFESQIVGGTVPNEFLSGIESGIKSVMGSGPLAGFPLIDFKVALIDGRYHDMDSSVLAFEIAARMCMREGLRIAGAKLLEPIMRVEVVTPAAYADRVIGDLTSRRGMINGQDSRGDASVICAFVPLALLFSYINSLLSMTSGLGSFRSEYSHHAPVFHSPDDPDDDVPAAMALRA
jgi:elongation factor G